MLHEREGKYFIAHKVIILMLNVNLFIMLRDITVYWDIRGLLVDWYLNQRWSEACVLLEHHWLNRVATNHVTLQPRPLSSRARETLDAALRTKDRPTFWFRHYESLKTLWNLYLGTFLHLMREIPINANYYFMFYGIV